MNHFAKIAEKLSAHELDGMLLTCEANRFYASGFHSTGTDGGVEAGGVKTVGLMGQQHTVQVTGFQLGGDFSKMIHRVTSWASIFATEAFTNP